MASGIYVLPEYLLIQNTAIKETPESLVPMLKTMVKMEIVWKLMEWSPEFLVVLSTCCNLLFVYKSGRRERAADYSLVA